MWDEQEEGEEEEEEDEGLAGQMLSDLISSNRYGKTNLLSVSALFV